MHTSWETLRYLETEPTARKYLASKYIQRGIDHPNRQAFQQSNRFLYTLKQARAYYHAASESDLLIKPLLLFYGCVNLLKALLIAQDPHYPQNSRMLQHGVTTRKIKKSPYVFLEDEIRPQKEGLFSVLTEKLNLSPICDRYSAHQLFSYLPELCSDFHRTLDQRFWYEVHVDRNHPDGTLLRFPEAQEGIIFFSPDTFIEILNRQSPDGLRFDLSSELQIPQKSVHYRVNSSRSLEDHPLFSLNANQFLFWNYSSVDFPLPAWASHYLLLYLLGMVCRYDTTWWGDLVLSHSYAEMFLIEQFLRTHERDFPSRIWSLMEQI